MKLLELLAELVASNKEIMRYSGATNASLEKIEKKPACCSIAFSRAPSYASNHSVSSSGSSAYRSSQNVGDAKLRCGLARAKRTIGWRMDLLARVGVVAVVHGGEL